MGNPKDGILNCFIISISYKWANGTCWMNKRGLITETCYGKRKCNKKKKVLRLKIIRQFNRTEYSRSIRNHFLTFPMGFRLYIASVNLPFNKSSSYNIKVQCNKCNSFQSNATTRVWHYAGFRSVWSNHPCQILFKWKTFSIFFFLLLGENV